MFQSRRPGAAKKRKSLRQTILDRRHCHDEAVAVSPTFVFDRTRQESPFRRWSPRRARVAARAINGRRFLMNDGPRGMPGRLLDQAAMADLFPLRSCVE